MLRLLRSGVVRRYFRYNAFRRGLLGQNKFWLTVFGAGLLGRQMGKITKGGSAPILFSEDLQVGQSYQIRHVPPPDTRRQRRKQRRRARRSA